LANICYNVSNKPPGGVLERIVRVRENGHHLWKPPNKLGVGEDTITVVCLEANACSKNRQVVEGQNKRNV